MSVPLLEANPPSAAAEAVSVFWTGGFDSTALVLRLLKTGKFVDVLYMKHSAGWQKCVREEGARDKIIEHIGNPRLRKMVIWDFDQLSLVPQHDKLFKLYSELADATGISYQYAALRFCRDVTGYSGPDIQLGIVQYDQLWERLLRDNQPTLEGKIPTNSTLGKFFAGFVFPVFWDQKADLWNTASPADQEILKLTFSCENSDKERRSCVEREVGKLNRCLPCQRRLEGLGS